LIAHTPINCPTREWSNVSEFEDWLRETENTPQARPPETAKDGQKLAFDTYLLAPSKSANSAPILCGIGGDFSHLSILIDGEITEVPLQWSQGELTATQIVEGKIAKKIMHSQKIVLCQVEDRERKWFEVTTLNDDLTYPFEACKLALKFWAFETYPEAKKQFKGLIQKARRGGFQWMR
jgi:hypothetical protein